MISNEDCKCNPAIRDAGANRERIVANLAVIVAGLERTFVPVLEAAVGPAPAFEPGR